MENESRKQPHKEAKNKSIISAVPGGESNHHAGAEMICLLCKFDFVELECYFRLLNSSDSETQR